MTKEQKAKIRQNRIEMQILYAFMRNQFGYEGDVYPSDVLYYWKWQYITNDGGVCDENDFNFDPLKDAAGMHIVGWRTCKDAEEGNARIGVYFFKNFQHIK